MRLIFIFYHIESARIRSTSRVSINQQTKRWGQNIEEGRSISYTMYREREQEQWFKTLEIQWNCIQRRTC